MIFCVGCGQIHPEIPVQLPRELVTTRVDQSILDRSMVVGIASSCQGDFIYNQYAESNRQM